MFSNQFRGVEKHQWLEMDQINLTPSKTLEWKNPTCHNIFGITRVLKYLQKLDSKSYEESRIIYRRIT